MLGKRHLLRPCGALSETVADPRIGQPRNRSACGLALVRLALRSRSSAGLCVGSTYPAAGGSGNECCVPDVRTFAKEVKKGDIIVTRTNFGCGSSREQAATCVKASGVGAVIAVSFSRLFFRNAINEGPPSSSSSAAPT